MILVIAEQRGGQLNRATWETIVGAQLLAGEMPVKVAVIGATAGQVPDDLASANVAEILVAEHEALEPYTPDGFVMALQALIEETAPMFVVLPHTYQTRDFAPALAARMGKSLVTDVTAIDGVGADATFARPMFQGKLSASVAPQGDAPHFVTFQIGAYRADAVSKGTAPAPITKVAATLDPSKIRQVPEAPFQEAQQAVDLSQAERIVAVGRGIKAQENLAMVESLAKALGAEVAASRPICDSGWLPMDRQIGSCRYSRRNCIWHWVFPVRSSTSWG